MIKRNISIYDFDDTIYNGNSIIDFWRFSILKHPGILIWVPYQMVSAVLWKCKKITADKFKETFLSFIKSVPSDLLEQFIMDFWETHKKKIPSWVPELIDSDQKKSLYPICISASPDFLLKSIIKEIGFKTLICTKFVKRGTVQTNRMKGSNCKGKEKVRRLNEWAQKEDIEFVVKKVYSDSITDLPLYEISREYYHVSKGILKKGLPI
jgi:HAD superfamily phosphoserine phosphatase-like hydrolase